MTDQTAPSGQTTRSATSGESGLAALPHHDGRWFIARGLLLIVLGLLAGLAPGWALFSFALLFAAFSFADGVLAIASGIRGAAHQSGQRHRRWWALVVSGLAGIAVGVLFVLFPLLSTIAYALVTVLIIAAWAIATGVLEIIASIRLRKEIEGEWLYVASGVASVLLGVGLIILALLDPSITVVSVGWMIALYALLAGVALVVLGFKLRARQATA